MPFALPLPTYVRPRHHGAVTGLSSWNLVEGAAGGDLDARSAFTDRFLPVVRAYLGARWNRTPFEREVDDAVQEVFVDCLREQGALERADRAGGREFRPFFFGVVRNVALRFEERGAREVGRRTGSSVLEQDRIAVDEPTLSRVFDAAWAQAIMQETATLQRSRAAVEGGRRLRRVELLRLRFEEGLPIREIAKLWDADAAELHHEYATAREEFRATLREVVALRSCCSQASVDAECESLIDLMNAS